MLAVFKFSHCLAHGVVARSRPGALAMALAVTLGALPCEALAASNGAAPSASLPPDEAPAPREVSYRGLLTASYVLAPFAALAVGAGLAELELSDELAVFGASCMSLAPATVHLAHGNGDGALWFPGLVLSTAGGLLLGGVTGHLIGQASCDPHEDSDGCDFASMDEIIYGALIGSVAAYTGFAIFDVTMHGATPVDEPPADHATLQLWLNPLPRARSERADSTSPFSGVQLGATLRM